ncbi:Serine/threonine-protein kinase, active site [Sesbania bispinosa]|nr:Serine/threonine-protein kinase, active site [Sesbania bispinosa]
MASTERWNFIGRGAGRRIGFMYEREVTLVEKKPSALQDLVLQATENLDDQYIVGKGAHGTVYKAKTRWTGFRCKEDYWFGEDYGLILYEFMENGSLHDVLHEMEPPPALTWDCRFKIAVGIAEGLAYLHYDIRPPIVHRDIKPKNILLDASMEPLIADFGTALYRNLSEDSNTNFGTRRRLSSNVAGTPGYIAPENAYAIVQSRKSDVYSYGVVLLELITRKKVLIQSLNNEAEVTTLVRWARSVWLETGKIEMIVDPYLASEFPYILSLVKQVTEVFLLALQCTERDPRQRPTMKDVIDFYKRKVFQLSGVIIVTSVVKQHWNEPNAE